MIDEIDNGFAGAYPCCRITLDPTPGVGWRLADRLDQTVSHMLVKTQQRPASGVFGIAGPEGACG
jgi:hypothetical protein